MIYARKYEKEKGIPNTIIQHNTIMIGILKYVPIRTA